MKPDFPILVPASHVLNLFKILEEMGFDSQALLRQSDLPQDMDQAPEHSQIFARRIEIFLNQLVQLLNLEQQKEFVKRSSRANARLLIQQTSFKHCRTLRDALGRIAGNVRQGTLGSHFGLDQKLGKNWFYRKQMFSSESWFNLSDAYMVLLLTWLVRDLLDYPEWVSTDIALLSRDNQSDLFVELFPGAKPNFYFSRGVTALALPESLLDSRIDPELLPADSQDMPELANTTTESLRQALPLYFGEGRPSVDKVAELSGMSSRTLKRRLQQEGTSYSELLDECILEQAKQLLADSEYSVAEIGMSLGYPYTNHFARTFKRLTGLTPTQYRSQFAR